MGSQIRFASRVPHRHYAGTLAEQLSQLYTDEVMLRFAASHFTPRAATRACMPSTSGR